jgi:hypothetical protein
MTTARHGQKGLSPTTLVRSVYGRNNVLLGFYSDKPDVLGLFVRGSRTHLGREGRVDPAPALHPQ